MPSNPRESLSPEKLLESPSAETLPVSDLSNEALLTEKGALEAEISDKDSTILDSKSCSSNVSPSLSPIPLKRSENSKKKLSITKLSAKPHKHFSSDILDDIKPEVKRRSPGRPRRKRSIDELPRSGLSGKKSLSSKPVSSKTLHSPELSADEFKGISRNSKNDISRKQTRRQTRTSSISPPPIRNSSIRRRIMSRQTTTQSTTRVNSILDSNKSPSLAPSPSPSPAPSASGDKYFNLSDLSEEQLKVAQKEAVSLLKRIEAEFTRLKSMIYQEKLAELMLDVSAIQDGKSPLLHIRAREAKERYKKRILSARRQREYSLWEASSQLAAQQYTIDTQFLHDKMALQQRLHDQVLKDRWEIEEAKIIYEARQVNPQICRISPEPENNASLPIKPMLTFHNVIKGLSEEESFSDLSKMRSARLLLASSSPEELREQENGDFTSGFTPKIQNGPSRWTSGYQAESPAGGNMAPETFTEPLHISDIENGPRSNFYPYPPEKPLLPPDSENSKAEYCNSLRHLDVQAVSSELLQIDNVDYHVGDRVLLLDHSQAVTYHARLSSVSSGEVSLLKFDGTRTRIPFSLLSQGRYQISFTPET